MLLRAAIQHVTYQIGLLQKRLTADSSSAKDENVAMLLSQLGVPTSTCMDASQLQAWVQLFDLVHGSPQNVDTVVEAGAVPRLVAWLRSDQVWAWKRALPLLAPLLMKSQRSRVAFLAAAAVPILIPLMQSPDFHVQVRAILAVEQLAFQCQRGPKDIIAAGALPILAGYCSADQFALYASASEACVTIVESISKHNNEAVFIPALVPALVPKLRSEELRVQEVAASHIARLAEATQVYHSDIIAADALPLLMVNLQSDSPLLRACTVDALANLAAGTEESLAAVSAQINTAEAFPALAALLHLSDSDWLTHAGQEAAARTPTSLARHLQQNKDSIVAAGAVPQLAALLSSDNFVLQNLAVAALGSIGAGTQANKDAVVASGALPLLAALLISGQTDGRTMVAYGFAGLAARSLQVTKDAIVTAGALPGLIGLMTSGQHDENHMAALAIAYLADDSQESNTAVIAAGALPPLIALLDSDQFWAQAHAAAALVHLAAGSPQHQAAMVVEGAPPALVRLLGNPDAWLQQEAALALTYIAQSQPGRAAITQADAAPALAAKALSNNSNVVQRAVECIAQLAKGSHHERDAIIASDALPRLAILSSSNRPHIQESARAAMIMTLLASPK